jgi:hypothetical protein
MTGHPKLKSDLNFFSNGGEMKYLIILFLMAACGGGSSGGGSSAAPAPAPVPQNEEEVVDFASVRSQILAPRCFSCHSEAAGNEGGVNLETYENVNVRLSAIQTTVNTNQMPPSRPLPDNLKALLNNWIENGAPENTPNALKSGLTCDEKDSLQNLGIIVMISDELMLNLERGTLFRSCQKL